MAVLGPGRIVLFFLLSLAIAMMKRISGPVVHIQVEEPEGLWATGLLHTQDCFLNCSGNETQLICRNSRSPSPVRMYQHLGIQHRFGMNPSVEISFLGRNSITQCPPYESPGEKFLSDLRMGKSWADSQYLERFHSGCYYRQCRSCRGGHFLGVVQYQI